MLFIIKIEEYIVVFKAVYKKIFKSNISNKNINYIFLNGGCYFFAEVTKEIIKDSQIMFNKEKEHCAVFYNEKIFDISGIISNNNFTKLNIKTKNYCNKHYIPNFIKSQDEFNYYKNLFIKNITSSI